jgi:hypothetical protein
MDGMTGQDIDETGAERHRIDQKPPFLEIAPLGDIDPLDGLQVILGQRSRFLTLINQPLVLISQVQRSGGTLISQLLDGHSELHVHPRELHIGRPNKYHWPKLDLSHNHKPGFLFQQLREMVVLDFARHGYQKFSPGALASNPELAEVVHPFIFHYKLQRDLFARLIRVRSPTTQRAAIDAYVTCYFNAWLDYQGLYRPPGQVKYWAAFVARLLADPANLDGYLADYPNGRILVPIRDPVSWYASASRHTDEYADPQNAMQIWMAANLSILKGVKRHRKLIMLVQLDRLVAETEATMRQVAKFLGIGFEPILMRPTFNGMDIASGSSFQVSYGVDPSSRDRSQHVDPETRRFIGSMAGDLHGRLTAIAERQRLRYA